MIWDSLAEVLRERVKPPLAVILGSPHEVAGLLGTFGTKAATACQMDLYQAGQLREELARKNLEANVVALADLWDLPAEFQTALFPTGEGGERNLKIDMVEQAFHVLRPHGMLMVTRINYFRRC